MEKMYIQVGLFIDVLYSQNPFVKGVFLFIEASEGRRIEKKE
ncbi:hypothetical protein P799_05745 [Lysinibacillus sphaericus CBAM5]|uniref:Uncharacterized protein n=2 Tax=Lysinibacillus sphaericus TaxID=1421 RepID=B1HU64_LYSSC|nr:hypothetical protein Bsph_2042 [Lysinibacillus sphaericus C3-41]EWH34186.1 hypothetical protein P799_05745 [Lysinibacillus sphaericus CBAM5]